ncbi:alpha/beta fold hydrolase [Streptomyces sp. NPDC015144]|uniref:alpha/beta fold hydrolase n=1 Tax=Streptomyces sp. NPDC015144 TaxID=3364944 RepID=UPI0036F53AEA
MRRVTVQVDGFPMVGRRAPGPGGPPVVCVHGAGISSRAFRPFLAELGGQHDTWAVDLPGCGASAAPSGRMPLRALADALVQWLPATGPEPVVLLGGSFGCQIAVDVAVRYPDRVAGLVLVGPTVDPKARTAPRQLVRWLRNAPYERPSMARLNVADYRDAGLRRVRWAFAEALRDRVEDKLPHVHAPTLVVRGSTDRLVPQEWAEEATALLPSGRLAVVEGAGHMVPHRRPAELASIVREFLADRCGSVGVGGGRGSGA